MGLLACGELALVGFVHVAAVFTRMNQVALNL